MNRREFLGLVAATSLPLLEDSPSLERTVDVFEKGSWRRTSFAELREGTLFRLWEPDGSFHVDENQDCIFGALGHAVPQPAPMLWAVPFLPCTRIGMDHPWAHRILVLRGGKPLGLVQRLDLLDMTCVREGGLESFDEVIVRPV